jgi:hypothetical protein
VQSSGIQHVFTLPDTHAQNGRVERVHLTIINGVWTSLADSGLDMTLWAKAAAYMAYTRNCTPCGPEHMIPDDVWSGEQRRLDHLQAFGSELYFRDYHNSNKLDNRYIPGRLLGYVDGTHNYRVWSTKHGFIKTRDVVITKQ